MASIEQTLHTLRDVEGVYGSFVITGSGALIASDLPTIFDGVLFDEVGPRITRLYETFRSSGDELDGCVLRYSEHKLHLRAMTWGFIGILAAVAVNKPALRMVVNLVIRRIDPEVTPSLRPLLPPSIPTPAPVARPANPAVAPAASMLPAAQPPHVASSEKADSSPPTGSRNVRMYRGRPVSDE